MAELNYINPASLFPEVEGKPIGGLAGVLTSQKMRDYETMMALQKMTQGMGAIKQQSELSDFLQDQPIRDLERNEKIQNIPMEGQAKRENLRGQIAFNYPNAEQDAALKRLTNKEKENKINSTELQEALDVISGAGSAIKGSGPLAYSALEQYAKSRGVDPNSQFMQYMRRYATEEDMKKAIDEISKSLVETPKHLQKREEWEADYKRAIDVAKIQAAAREAAAKSRGGGNEQQFKTLQAYVVSLMQKREKDPNYQFSEPEKEAIALYQYQMALRETAAAGRTDATNAAKSAQGEALGLPGFTTPPAAVPAPPPVGGVGGAPAPTQPAGIPPFDPSKVTRIK